MQWSFKHAGDNVPHDRVVTRESRQRIKINAGMTGKVRRVVDMRPKKYSGVDAAGRFNSVRHQPNPHTAMLRV